MLFFFSVAPNNTRRAKYHGPVSCEEHAAKNILITVYEALINRAEK